MEMYFVCKFNSVVQLLNNCADDNDATHSPNNNNNL